MPWNNTHKILFIHIPKTAGSSLETALEIYGKKEFGYETKNGKAIQHYLWKDYKKEYPHIFNTYTKISIVRNPYTRFLSEYYWCEIEGVGKKSNQEFDDFLSFAEEVVKGKKYNDSIYHDHFIPQYHFIYDASKQEIVTDKLFYFENIDVLKNFLKNQNQKLPHALKTKKNKLVLNQVQKDRIYNLYKEDFKILNYKQEFNKENRLISFMKKIGIIN
ncbi:MAG: sulfotransferase family 2 domain-containing protein [Flavobacteriales bacterium]